MQNGTRDYVAWNQAVRSNERPEGVDNSVLEIRIRVTPDFSLCATCSSPVGLHA